ncbi:MULTISPECIES: PEP-CTERM sorting domain-containing protein [unclassified Microcystis]|nr:MULTISPECIES: PEP-CTERM sorting domain-containing protein [unclassified Microcystis]
MFYLDFQTVPEPSTLIALIMFGSILLTRSRSKN